MAPRTYSLRWRALLLGLCLALVHRTTADPTTYSLQFSNAGFGPDGPWNILNQTVDFPDQYLLLYPSLSKTNLFVPTSACKPTNANCPQPLPGLWAGSGAQNIFAAKNGPDFDAPSWDNLSEPLGLQGTGHYMTDRITLQAGSTSAPTAFLDGVAVVDATNFSISYPGGAKYTMDTGFFSLYGQDNTITYKNASGAQVTLNTTMAEAYLAKYIPSKSYGLHIGSSAYSVPASLIMGGYDSSRALSDPIIGSSTNTFTLNQLSFNVASGGSAYTNIDNTASGLKTTAQTANLQVRVEPGAPYLYLPQSVCDGLTKYLPVTFNKDFNLYTWNINSPAYQAMITSPHYLSFSFAAGTTTNPTNTTSINIPLALLSLNLTAPLSTVTTPYFPCRPYSPSDSTTYILGRAFLQGAFIAQNWNAGKLWLSQAPGPYLPPGNVVTFSATDGSIAPKGNQVSWDTTWSTVLKPLASSINSNNSGSSSSGSGSGSGTNNTTKTSGLSTGAKAGIGVGIALGVLLLAGLIFLLLRSRKRKHQRAEMEAGALEQDNLARKHPEAKYGPPMSQHAGAELPTDRQRYEMDGNAAHGVGVGEGHAKPATNVVNLNEHAPQELQGDVPSGHLGSTR